MMMTVDAGDIMGGLVGMVFFAMIAAIVIYPAILKTKHQKEVQETIRHALDKGTSLPADFMQALRADTKGTPQHDLRRGLIFLAVGIGIALLGIGISVEEADAIGPLLGSAAIPAMIGVAHIILWAVNRKRDDAPHVSE